MSIWPHSRNISVNLQMHRERMEEALKSGDGEAKGVDIGYYHGRAYLRFLKAAKGRRQRQLRLPGL